MLPVCVMASLSSHSVFHSICYFIPCSTNITNFHILELCSDEMMLQRMVRVFSLRRSDHFCLCYKLNVSYPFHFFLLFIRWGDPHGQGPRTFPEMQYPSGRESLACRCVKRQWSCTPFALSDRRYRLYHCRFWTFGKSWPPSYRMRLPDPSVSSYTLQDMVWLLLQSQLCYQVLQLGFALDCVVPKRYPKTLEFSLLCLAAGGGLHGLPASCVGMCCDRCSFHSNHLLRDRRLGE